MELTAAPDTSGEGALRRLLSCEVADFEAWGRTVTLRRGRGSFADLFSLAAADELIATGGLRTPFIRLAKDGDVLASRSFTRSGGVGAGIGDQVDSARVLRELAAGATIVLQALHRNWPPLREFVAVLADELRHPVQVNAYVTPQLARGFAAHYDTHDVFVVQIEGTKRWRIHEPVLTAPLESQPWTDRKDEVAKAALEEPVHDVLLEPGDVVYLPRGWIHSAEANAQTSLHLTFGVHPYTRIDLLRAELEEDPAYRESLPLGVEVPERLRRRWLEASRPLPVRPIETEAALHTIDEDTVVRLRPYLYAEIREGRVEAGDLSIEIPPGLAGLLDGHPHRVGADAVDLVRTLVRDGLLLIT